MSNAKKEHQSQDNAAEIDNKNPLVVKISCAKWADLVCGFSAIMYEL